MFVPDWNTWAAISMGRFNIPAPDLRTRHVEIDRENPVIVICNVGQRGILGRQYPKTAWVRGGF